MKLPVRAALLGLLLIAACRIHVTIWLIPGHMVIRPPIAGVLFAAMVLACAGGLAAVAWVLVREFRPHPRPVWSTP